MTASEGKTLGIAGLPQNNGTTEAVELGQNGNKPRLLLMGLKR